MDKEYVKAIQSELARKGLYAGKIDGIMGPKTRAAIAADENGKREETRSGIGNSVFLDNIARYANNVTLKNPVMGVVDGGLYLADILGAPTNATNFLRDLNVSVPYRLKAAISAAAKYLVNDKSYSDTYEKELANPSFYTRFGQISPLTNTNANYSNSQRKLIKKVAGEKSYITNKDIRENASDNTYGASGTSISRMFTDEKVVQSSIGQSLGKNGVLTDTYDTNTSTPTAKRDNAHYLQRAWNLKNKFSYGTLRALMPYIASTDEMPDENKIHTIINLNDIR